MTLTKMGILNIVSAMAPERIETPQPQYTTKKSDPNMPTTIEGRLDSVSIAVEAAEVTQFSGAYSTRKMAAPNEMGTEITRVTNSI